MKIFNLLLALIVLASCNFALAGNFLNEAIPAKGELFFIENINNSNATGEAYTILNNNYNLKVDASGIEVTIYKKSANQYEMRKGFRYVHENFISTIEETESFRINFDNSNIYSKMLPNKEESFYVNFYYGDTHVEGVKAYKAITLENLYEGVDLTFDVIDSKIDMIFAADSKKALDNIKMSIESENAYEMIDNSIHFDILGHDISFNAPKININNSLVNANFSENNGGLQLTPDFNNKTQEQTPAIEWTKILGGGQDDQLWRMKRDNNNNLVAIGYTNSTNDFFPQSSNGSLNNGAVDMFMIKYNSAGVIQWMTFFGGSNFDEPFNLDVDDNFEIVVSGRTNSENYPTTAGVVQTTIGSPNVYDAFISKFATNGNLVWSTFWGGNQEEGAIGVSFAGDGFVNVGGYTQSRTNQGFVVTNDAFQSQFIGGTAESGNGDWANSDAFLLVLTSNGNLFFSSYLGGAGNDAVIDIATDKIGFPSTLYDVIAVGHTYSNNFFMPTNTTPWQQQYAQNGDAFITRFDGLNNLKWSTYYGGNGWDELSAVDLDRNSNILVSGNTSTDNSVSATFEIASFGAFQEYFGGGGWDGMVALFKNNGSERIWGSYFGYETEEIITDLDVSLNGVVVISGYGNLYGDIDFVFGTFNTLGGKSNYYNGEYYFIDGGYENDFGNAIVFTSDYNCIYMAGKTYSDDLPNLLGQEQYKGNGDGYLMRICNMNTSIEDNDFDNNSLVNVYPQPSNDVVNIKLLYPSEETFVKVIDEIGNVVKEVKFFGDYYLLDISELSQGFYIIQLNSNTQSSVQKIIKK